MGPIHGSGDGWTTCGLGHRHWGRYGAAGLLLRSALPFGGGADGVDVLLQLRSRWSHHGGTWGIPGGARDRDESAVRAAVREAAEEVGLTPSSVRPEAAYLDDHGGWSYTTVVASARGAVDPEPSSAETDDVRWVSDDRVETLSLHLGFARTWATVSAITPAPVLVVDAANTIGSRPDGWWRDRIGAVRRLRDDLTNSLSGGLTLGLDGALPELRVFPEIVLVTEGAARGVEQAVELQVLPAPGSGDDTIVEVVSRYASGPRPVLVVTADRALRQRVGALGATSIGPRRLLDLIPA
ncbi:MAG: NUDIX domain-containing protein [Propionibacteriaceae bacterium]